MKITVERERILSALSFVERRSRRGHGIPILGNALLSVGGGELTLTGHDLDSSSQAIIATECEAEGSCTVPTGQLLQLAKSFSGQSHIAISADARIAEIKSGRSRYKLPVLPASDFPEMFEPQSPAKVLLDAKAVVQLFERSCPVINPADPRAPYQGVTISPNADGFLTSAATDGVHILRFTSDIKVETGAPAIIVSHSSAAEIARTANGGGALSWSDKLLSVASISEERHTFCTKLIDGKPLDFERANFQAKEKPFVDLEREQVIAVLSRLSILAQRNSLVTLNWEADPSEASLDLVDMSSGTEPLACKSSLMAAGDISFPPGQMLNLLEALRGPRVQFLITDERTPFRVFDPDEPTALAVQVPAYTGQRKKIAA